MKISKIDEDWQEAANPRGEQWRFRDLSGQHLGVRIEELSAGATSSEHHYHTAEEEHVIALEGAATLVVGEDRQRISAGEHVWFKAGDALPHHIVNDTDEPFRFLVFGERKSEDVVIYPEHQVMMLKTLGFQQFTYRAIDNGSDDS